MRCHQDLAKYFSVNRVEMCVGRLILELGLVGIFEQEVITDFYIILLKLKIEESKSVIVFNVHLRMCCYQCCKRIFSNLFYLR